MYNFEGIIPGAVVPVVVAAAEVVLAVAVDLIIAVEEIMAEILVDMVVDQVVMETMLDLETLAVEVMVVSNIYVSCILFLFIFYLPIFKINFKDTIQVFNTNIFLIIGYIIVISNGCYTKVKIIF